MADTRTDWALALFRRSVLKQRKLAEITALLGPSEGRRCLDLGSDNGVVSLLLRRRGGSWASADLTEEAVRSIQELVTTDVHLVDGRRLPFPDGEFDAVAVVDMLEHVPDDRAFLAELGRILRPGGRLVVNTPHLRTTRLRRLRERLGQTDERHGHVRPGYTAAELRTLVEEGGRFRLDTQHTYSRFFSEMIDTGIQWGLQRLGKKGSAKGVVVTRGDMGRYRKSFLAYSAMYPLVASVSSLDRLIAARPGYMLIASATRT